MSVTIRAQRTRRTVSVLLASGMAISGLALGVAQPAAAVVPDIINEPPVAPVILTAFPSRDFVSGEGFGVDSLVDVEVWRNGVLAGFANDIQPTDVPATPGFDGFVEVNHPGAACWDTTTPNLQAGDQVRFVEKLAAPLPGLDGIVGTADDVRNVAQQTTVADIAITDAPGLVNAVTVVSADTVQVRGTLARNVDINDLAHEFIASSGDPFNMSGTRIISADTTGTTEGVLALDPTDPNDTTWVATYTGLDAHDVQHVLNVAANNIAWGPLAAPTHGTIVEFGELDGPQSPCTSPKAGPQADASSGRVLFPATDVAATSATSTVTITNDGVGPISDLQVASVSATGAFSVTAETCTAGPVAPGATCDVTVAFAPTAAGQADGALTVASNSINGATTVALTGVGTTVGATAASHLFVATPTVDFGTRVTGNQTPAQAITISNIGNATATLGAPTLTGANSADWTIAAGGTCATTLAAGASCTVNLVFTPGAEGSRAAALEVSAADSATVSVQLTGAGLITSTVQSPPAAGKVVSGFVSRDFVSTSGFDPAVPVIIQVVRHNVVVGTTDPFLPDANGIAEVNHPGAACWLGVTPDLRAGDKVRVTDANGAVHEAIMGDLELTAPVETAPGSGVVQVKGRAADAAGKPLPINSFAVELISGSANRYDINGRRLIGAPGEGLVEFDAIDPVTNPDGLNFTATFSGLGAADVVRATQQSTPTMVWLGRDPGTASEETIFELGEINGPQAPCTAPAAAPDADILVAPMVRDFPSRQAPRTGFASTFVQRDVTVRSSGLAPLTISSMSIAGVDAADFILAPTQPATACALNTPIAVGSECVVRVRFRPRAVGARTATLQLFTNVIGTPTVVTLTGIGTAAAESYATVTPIERDFAESGVNIAAPARNVTVKNDGEAPLSLTIGAIEGANAGDFTILNVAATTCDDGPVAVNATCVIRMRFRPQAVGNRSATLTLTPNSSQAPVVVHLSGQSLSDGGFMDPPLAPRSFGVFPERDFVSLTGYTADDFVTVQVVRNGVVIGETLPAIPQDDPTTNAFDGIVEVNHIGGMCWVGTTPDIKAGDIVRAFATDALGITQIRNGRDVADQTMVQDLVITQPATQVAPGTVVVKGYTNDVRNVGQRLAIGALEVRLVAAGAAEFEKNARRLLRADVAGAGDGTIAYDGLTNTFVATFSGLSAADVALATDTTTGNVSLWLGRDPAAGVESTHYEWGEAAGAQPPCDVAPDAAPISAGVGSVAPAMAGINGEGGLIDLGLVSNSQPSATRTVTLTNIGFAPMTVSSLRTDLGLDTTNFAVAPGTDLCTGVTLAPDASCTIGVRFAPPTQVAQGNRAGSLLIYSDGAHSPVQVVLRASVPGVPTITGVTPSPTAPGSDVTVTGTNLSNIISATLIGTNALAGIGTEVAAADVVGNGTNAVVTLPLSGLAAFGTYQVRLVTFGGTVTSTASFEVAGAAPVVTSFTPLQGVRGATVTVTGSGFHHPVTGVSIVTGVSVGGVAATSFNVVSNTSLTLVVPVGAVDGRVAVTTAGGTSSSAASFDVWTPPVITAVAPSPARPGTVVTVTGVDFIGTATAATGVPTVTLNGTNIPTRTVNATGTSMTLTLPAAASNGELRITARGGVGVSTLLVVQAAPTITSFSPTSAGAGVGAVVTVNGRNYVGVQSVTIGGVAAPFTVVNPNQMRVTVPAGAVTGRISVRTGFGSVNSAANFTVIARPTITSFTPTQARVGTRVTINGTNLAGTTAVTIGGVRVTTFVSRTATRVVVTAPAGMTIGLAPIRVETPGGVAVSAAAFRALP